MNVHESEIMHVFSLVRFTMHSLLQLRERRRKEKKKSKKPATNGERRLKKGRSCGVSAFKGIITGVEPHPFGLIIVTVLGGGDTQ